MKKLVISAVLILSLSMLFCSFGCVPAQTQTNADPTQDAALVTGEPDASEAPDDALPTEAPAFTHDPDAVIFELMEYFASLEQKAFDGCAEKIISLAPDDPGPLYDHGWAETSEGEASPAFGPTWFSVDGDMVCVSDGGMTDASDRTIFAYDIKAGSASRIPYGIRPYGYMPMIVSDGVLYSVRSAEDLITGRKTEIEAAVPNDFELEANAFMTAYDGRIHYVVTYSPGTENDDPQSCAVYTFDFDSGKWEKSEFAPGFTDVLRKSLLVGIFPDGGYCFALEFGDESEGLIHLVRTDEGLSPIAAVTLPYSWKELEPLDYSYRTIVGRDGMVYFMACLEEEFVVWRIDLG